jgi:hypothetical protein
VFPALSCTPSLVLPRSDTPSSSVPMRFARIVVELAVAKTLTPSEPLPEMRFSWMTVPAPASIVMPLL